MEIKFIYFFRTAAPLPLQTAAGSIKSEEKESLQ